MTSYYLQVPNGFSLSTQIQKGVPHASFSKGRIFYASAPTPAADKLTVRVEADDSLMRPATAAEIKREYEFVGMQVPPITPEDETTIPSPNVLVLSIEGPRGAPMCDQVLLPAFPVV